LGSKGILGNGEYGIRSKSDEMSQGPWV